MCASRLSARTLLQGSQQAQSYNLMHVELLKCLLLGHFSTAAAVTPEGTIPFNNRSRWGTLVAAASANARGTGTLPRTGCAAAATRRRLTDWHGRKLLDWERRELFQSALYFET